MDSSGSTGAPATGDDLYISNNAVDIDAGLSNSSLSIGSLTIDQSYTGRIGTTSAYLDIGTVTGTVTIGQSQADGNTAQGSGRIKLNFSTSAAVVNVLNSSTASSDTGLPPIRLAGTVTSLNIIRGKVGIACSTPVETATATTINVNRDPNSTAPTLYLGLVTNTTINNRGGNITSRASATCTTLNNYDGTMQVEGTQAVTNVNLWDGTVVHNGTGTMSTVKVYGGKLDFSADGRSKTVSACDVYGPCEIDASTGVAGSVTFTAGIDFNGVELDQCTVRIGNNRRITPAATA